MPADRLAIITWHRLDDSGEVIATRPSVFRRQMAQLADLGLRGISLESAFDYLEDHGCFPDDAVVLTFDDGFSSVASVAAGELSRHGFGATFFITTEFVGSNGYLDKSDLQALAASGYELGGHTLTHPDLTRISAGQLSRELEQGKQTLELWTQREVESFAYPFGYHDAASRRAASRHYQRACTTELGHVNPAQELMRLKRLDAYFLETPATWEKAVTGKGQFYWSSRQWLRNLKDRFR